MSAHATPYIAFHGQAGEALEFYCEVFGGEFKTLLWPGSQRVMHGQLVTAAGWHLMAADDPEATGDFPAEQRVTTFVWGDDESALRTQFDRLAADGRVIMPLEPQEWGGTLGVVRDRYDVEWGFSFASSGD